MAQSAESTKVQQDLTRFSDTQTTTGIVVYTRPGGLTAADRDKINADKQAFADHLSQQLGGPPFGPQWR